MPSQQVLQRKLDEIEDIIRLIKQYEVIGIADLQKVRAAQLQKFKKNLGEEEKGIVNIKWLREKVAELEN